MKPWNYLPALSAVVFLGLCAPASASSTFYVYNSFGPGGALNNLLLWAVEGASTTHGYRGQAEFFVPGTAGYLSSIQLAMYYYGGSGFAEINLTQNNGGVPGANIESFVNVPGSGIITLGSASHPLLQAGVEYWLTVEPDDDPTTNLGWFVNSQGVANGFAFDRSPGDWQFFLAPPPNQTPASGVFSISVTPVPEPSAAALVIGLGSCLLACRLRRSRH